MEWPQFIKQWKSLWFNQARRDIHDEVSQQLDEKLANTPFPTVPRLNLTDITPLDTSRSLVEKAVFKSRELNTVDNQVLQAGIRQIERRQESLEAIVLVTKSRDAVDDLINATQTNPDVTKRLGEYGISMEHIVKLRDVLVSFLENISTSGHYQEMFRGIRDSTDSAILATQQLNRTAKALVRVGIATGLGILALYGATRFYLGVKYGEEVKTVTADIASVERGVSKLEKQVENISTKLEAKVDKGYVGEEVAKETRRATDELDSFKVAYGASVEESRTKLTEYQTRLNEAFHKLSRTEQTIENNRSGLVEVTAQQQRIIKAQENILSMYSTKMEALGAQVDVLKRSTDLASLPVYKVDTNIFYCPIDFKGLVPVEIKK